MKLVDHPNIVKLFEFYEDVNAFYIVTEYVQGGQLLEHIQRSKNFSENVAAKIMAQVLSAIHHCHEKNVVHRDIKPDNILIDTAMVSKKGTDEG
jgi:calcium-dependent protein kinase